MTQLTPETLAGVAVPTSAEQPARTILSVGAGVVVVTSLIVICFQMYWQYWFLRLLHGHILSTLAPIAVLGCMMAREQFLRHVYGVRVGPSFRHLLWPLAFLVGYLMAATLSVLAHESGDLVRRYLIYLYSPIAVFAGVAGVLRSYSTGIQIRILRCLVATAVLIVLLTLPFYLYDGGSILPKLNPVVTTNGEVRAYSGGTTTNGGLRVRRLYASGLNVAASGYALTALVFASLASRIRVRRRHRMAFTASAFLFGVCTLLTLSRGPIVLLASGIVCWICAPPRFGAAATRQLLRWSMATRTRVMPWTVAVAAVLCLFWLSVYVYDGRPPLTPLTAQESAERRDSGSEFGYAPRLELRRFAFLGVNSTTSGAMLVPFVLLVLSLRNGASTRSRMVYSGIALLLGLCVVLTVSRIAVAALGAGVGFLWWHRTVSTAALGTAALVAVAIIPFTVFAMVVRFEAAVLTVLPPPMAATVQRWSALSDAGDDPHVLQALQTVAEASENLSLGMGMSTFTELQNGVTAGVQRTPDNSRSPSSEAPALGKTENNYLSIAASFGALAMSCYVLFLVSMMWLMTVILRRRESSKPGSDDQMTNLGIGLLAGMWALVVYLNGAPAEFHFIWAWFGFVALWIVAAGGTMPAADRASPTYGVSVTAGSSA